MTNFPNTGSTITPEPHQRTNSGLSTQIIVKVNETPIGALQNLTVNQNRPLKRINEIGTDGNIEIVPQSSTTYDLNVTRIVFDQLRLPEAFARAFRFIGAQRIPFDIDIYDMQANSTPNEPSGPSGLVVMTFTNCWFNTYSTPYTVDDYTVIETATIWAETASVKNGGSFTPPSLRTVNYQTDPENIESSTNIGGRRGAMDAAGILNSLFPQS